ncbi:MAG: hypothetical protein JW910_18630 [Anaerolineae bacterium]|nr:hypothetical protein [Anaerolineae bacterium]
MRYRVWAVIGLMVLAAVACTPAQQAVVQTVVAALPDDDAPLGGAVAAMPTPDQAAATATPASSSYAPPTSVPTASGPLAALTQVAQLIPTQDTSATPYAIVNQGRPHFIEFHARW